NEIHSDYFMVEKSGDGITFEPFKRVDCQKRSSASYRTSDESPYVGSTYYRLKQIDVNGSYKYSDIKSVNLKTFDITTIFPVPAKDHISFAFQSSEDKDVLINIVDVTGKKVYTRQAHIQKGVSVLEVELPSVQSALYLLQVYDPLSNVQSSKEFYISN
ncbi:MAG TPA: T9SS type A sorting domain-containing protein, partial [Cytophagaceae bacterium]